ncbi:hypothetical protein Gasu2_55680 [Galdieria sulphuraria]|uniref:Uncharacterized protein n=1 Tax=Galdieria sulphuraria TaxID=130081 RepID=M2XZY3_GALSU|nr:uncharacterized protein Gasu_33950 [Galdieria sulphuraria]EME29193.1 hypothetical protein Gasu_33950 [Galdieria sulphuraria]GJD11429.1 hypothetical protein Gasu2_55680 [Galdieria sulphuraria]|eukprot:XP_005705713.1 hypothetical protein Gasu_33950 [Galdieria sulphuraria]
MRGFSYRLPAAFLENDVVMAWLLEEDVEKGLSAEVVRQRMTPVQATFAYKSIESWHQRKDIVLIIPSQTVGNFALCYCYGPLNQSLIDKGKVEIAWCRLVFDLQKFYLLQFIRSEGKIRSWLLLEHISTTKTIQTTTTYFEAEKSRNHCLKTVTISVEHSCALCQLASDKCLCHSKQSEKRHDTSLLQSSVTAEPLKGHFTKLGKISFSVPPFSGSLFELLSTSPSRGYIEVAQYSMKKGNLLHYSKAECFTNVLPLKHKLAESCYFQAIESLLSKTRAYYPSIPLSFEKYDHQRFLNKTLKTLDHVSEHPGFSSNVLNSLTSQWPDSQEGQNDECSANEWFLSPFSSKYSLDTLESSETNFSDRWDL